MAGEGRVWCGGMKEAGAEIMTSGITPRADCPYEAALPAIAFSACPEVIGSSLSASAIAQRDHTSNCPVFTSSPAATRTASI